MRFSGKINMQVNETLSYAKRRPTFSSRVVYFLTTWNCGAVRTWGWAWQLEEVGRRENADHVEQSLTHDKHPIHIG